MTERERERIAEAKALSSAAANLMSQARALASGYIPVQLRSRLSAAQDTLGDFEMAMQTELHGLQGKGKSVG